MKKFFGCFISMISCIVVIAGGLLYNVLNVSGNASEWIVNIKENYHESEGTILLDYMEYLEGYLADQQKVIFPTFRHDCVITIVNNTDYEFSLPASQATLIYSKGEPKDPATSMEKIYHEWWQYGFHGPDGITVPLTPVAKFDNLQLPPEGGVSSEVSLFSQDIHLAPGEQVEIEMSFYFHKDVDNPYMNMEMWGELSFAAKRADLPEPTSPTEQESSKEPTSSTEAESSTEPTPSTEVESSPEPTSSTEVESSREPTSSTEAESSKEPTSPTKPAAPPSTNPGNSGGGAKKPENKNEITPSAIEITIEDASIPYADTIKIEAESADSVAAQVIESPPRTNDDMSYASVLMVVVLSLISGYIVTRKKA